MRDGLVLTYHSVSSSAWGPLCTPAEAFRAQIRWLAEAGFRGVSLREWCSAEDRSTVGVTFDDGYRDNLTTALPILREWGFSATMFVTTDYIGAGRPFPWAKNGGDDQLPLDWSGVRALLDAGVEIGSHTASHPCLRDLPDDAAQDEILRSRCELQDRLGTPIESFCYPFGRFTLTHCEQVRRAGYSRAVGPTSPAIPAGPFTIPRVGIHGHNTLPVFRLKTSRLGRALLRLRRRHWGTEPGAVRRGVRPAHPEPFQHARAPGERPHEHL
jgi:peptidoglycan/xylan/chitin deacetylase (PgdA/CDA1 family)